MQPQRTPKFNDYIRVFKYATRWDIGVYIIASTASIGAGITLPLMNIIFGQLVGQFNEYFGDSTAISRDNFERILNQQALYIMALFLVRWALSSINKFCFRMIGIRLSSAVLGDYLRALFAQSVDVIDSMPAGGPATAITVTSDTLQIGISERLGTFVQYQATVWAGLVVALVWSWDLPLVTSTLLIYIIAVLCFVTAPILKGQTATIQADAESIAVASEALEVIRLVISCGAEGRIMSRYKDWVAKAKKRGQKVAPIVGLQFGLVVCLVSQSAPFHDHLFSRNYCSRPNTGLVLRRIRVIWAGLLVRQSTIRRRCY